MSKAVAAPIAAGRDRRRTHSRRHPASSQKTHRWRGVDSNFWFRARSECGRVSLLRLYLGRIALRPHVGPGHRRSAASSRSQTSYRARGVILVKLIVDAGTDRTANRLSSVMLRDDANPYRHRAALSRRPSTATATSTLQGSHLRTVRSERAARRVGSGHSSSDVSLAALGRTRRFDGGHCEVRKPPVGWGGLLSLQIFIRFKVGGGGSPEEP